MAEYHKILPQAPLMYDARKAAEQNGKAAMAWFAEYEQAAAALTEAQATIARLREALREASRWLDDYDSPPSVIDQINAALSPGKGE